MYKLQVVNNGTAHSNGNDIWDHFIDWVVATRGCEHIDAALVELGGLNLQGTPYIQFKTKDDALIFKLKFS